MRLWSSAQIGELLSDDAGFGYRSQHADGSFTAFQLAADPVTVGFVESQVLVVQPAAYQACGEPGGALRPGFTRRGGRRRIMSASCSGYVALAQGRHHRRQPAPCQRTRSGKR